MKIIEILPYNYILESLQKSQKRTKLRFIKKIYKKINKLFDTKTESICLNKFEMVIYNILNSIENFNTTFNILVNDLNYKNPRIYLYKYNIDKLYNELSNWSIEQLIV